MHVNTDMTTKTIGSRGMSFSIARVNLSRARTKDVKSLCMHRELSSTD
jgi:hypothetical protein